MNSKLKILFWELGCIIVVSALFTVLNTEHFFNDFLLASGALSILIAVIDILVAIVTFLIIKNNNRAQGAMLAAVILLILGYAACSNSQLVTKLF